MLRFYILVFRNQQVLKACGQFYTCCKTLVGLRSSDSSQFALFDGHSTQRTECKLLELMKGQSAISWQVIEGSFLDPR